MKIWLGNQQNIPDGWERATCFRDAIALLKRRRTTQMTLCSDLAMGYDVLLWIEHAIMNGLIPPKITLLNTNITPRWEIQDTVERIELVRRTTLQEITLTALSEMMFIEHGDFVSLAGKVHLRHMNTGLRCYFDVQCIFGGGGLHLIHESGECVGIIADPEHLVMDGWVLDVPLPVYYLIMSGGIVKTPHTCRELSCDNGTPSTR